MPLAVAVLTVQPVAIEVELQIPRTHVSWNCCDALLRSMSACSHSRLLRSSARMHPSTPACAMRMTYLPGRKRLSLTSQCSQARPKKIVGVASVQQRWTRTIALELKQQQRQLLRVPLTRRRKTLSATWKGPHRCRKSCRAHQMILRNWRSCHPILRNWRMLLEAAQVAELEAQPSRDGTGLWTR